MFTLIDKDKIQNKIIPKCNDIGSQSDLSQFCQRPASYSGWRYEYLGSDCLARVEGGGRLNFPQHFDDAGVAAIGVLHVLGQHLGHISERQMVLAPLVRHGRLAGIFALIENFLQSLFVPAREIIRVHDARSVGECVRTALPTNV